MIRSRIAACAVGAALVVGGVACGGDDEPGRAASTTTEPRTTTTGLGTDPTTTEAGATTEAGDPAATTSPNLPPRPDTDLIDLLVDPAALGDGFVPDDTLGDGTFDGDLCEDVIIEMTWEDEVGQALSRPGAAGKTALLQSVLGFADAAKAEAFVAEVGDGVVACLGAAEPRTIDAGDEAVLIEESDEEAVSTVALVRVGARVAALNALAPEAPSPIDTALLAAVASALAR